MQEVGALCDHIVVIAKGRVTAQGSPNQLLEQTGESTLEDAFVKAIGSDGESSA
jgi:sodium transport system ATP-binding protein